MNNIISEQSCPTLCGCKLSGASVEVVERLGAYRPDTHAVITTGNTNLVRSIEMPAIRGAILYCHEPPLYFPVLEAHAAGDRERALELEEYIGQSRGIGGAINAGRFFLFFCDFQQDNAEIAPFVRAFY